MVSAAEQLAANLNFSALGKAEELKKRIWFTLGALGALLVYRFGTYIPLPGIDPNIWEQVFRSQAGGILGMFNMFAGGGIHRMAIFALNIMPYISASIIIQLLTTVSPTLEALKKEGEAGRKTLNQYTRYLTVILAAFQSYGIAVGLEGAGNVVSDPGMFFRLSTAITLTGGTMFLMWLGEQITSRGIGNGISLIILAGIVAELPSALANMLELGRQGALSTGLILIVIVMAIAVIAFIVFMERAQRRLLIQYPKRQVGNKMFEGQSSHLPLKLNTSGVIPPIFASSLLLLPTTVANFNAGKGPEWFQWITTQLGHGRPLFLILYLALIVFFAFFYTAIVFNPTETADNLKKHGGFIPGIRPGERTAEYIDYVLSRITVLGAVYLAIVCLMNVAVDRGQRDHGYGGAGAGLSARPSIRRSYQEVEAERPASMKSELARRIVFTLGALLVFRLGSYIPLPGINAPGPQIPGVTVISGNRFSIFSLGILPYLSAAILIQLVSMVSSKLSALPSGGEAGRRKIARYTIGLAAILTAFQGFGIASGLQGIPNLVNEPGGFFVISTTVTLTGGTIFLIWLSEQITARGIGNGLALILFAGVAAEMPHAVAVLVEYIRQGMLSAESVAVLAILWVALVGLVVFVELAHRRVPVEFASRKLGDRLLPAQSTHLSLKLNSAGMMPTVVAPWLYLLPLTVAGLVLDQTSPWLMAVYGLVPQTHMARVILSSVAIIMLAFIYTAFVVDPEHAADSLNKHGGVIPGVEPGEPTAGHLDRIVSYTTCIGALYLAAVFLIPELLLVYGEAPFYLGGTTVLVVVCTVLDIETQVRGRSLTEPWGVFS